MKKVIVVLVVLSICFSANSYAQNKVVNAEDFGFSQSNPDNSAALQKAIDACGGDSGSKIIIPKGVFNFKNLVNINNAAIIGYKDATTFIFTEDFTFNKTSGSPRNGAFFCNIGYQRTYDDATANTIRIENINFITRTNSATPLSSTVLVLANVKSGTITNCNFTANQNSSVILSTLIDIYTCVKNVTISNCQFINLNAKAHGGGMWIRNQSADGGKDLNVTENINLVNDIFRHASGDEALSIFGSGGITRNITVDKCFFYGLASGVPHSVLLSVYPLNGRNGGQYAAVKNVKIQNSTFIDSTFRGYILRVGGNGLKDRGNVCDYITISGNHFYSYSKINIDKSSIIWCTKNSGDNVSAVNNTINSNSAVQYGIHGFDNVSGNTILGNNVQFGIYGAGTVKNNVIRAKTKGVEKSTSDIQNRVSIAN